MEKFGEGLYSAMGWRRLKKGNFFTTLLSCDHVTKAVKLINNQLRYLPIQLLTDSWQKVNLRVHEK